MKRLRGLCINITIRFIRQHIIDCKIRGDFIEGTQYRADLEWLINLLKAIKDSPAIQ